MDTIYTAAEARERLYHLIDEVSESHQPVTITGKRTNAVLISEEYYRRYARDHQSVVHTRHARENP